MIRIGDILDPNCVMMDLEPGSKQSVLRQMTERLHTLGRIDDPHAIHRLLMDREDLMTTGVRRGFAFPHAFSPQVDDSFLALGVIRDGIDFEALDGAPVYFVFLLLGPPDNQSVHLRILARVSRLTGQPEMLEVMLDARSPDQMMELINDSEFQLKTTPYVFPDPQE